MHVHLVQCSSEIETKFTDKCYCKAFLAACTVNARPPLLQLQADCHSPQQTASKTRLLPAISAQSFAGHCQRTALYLPII